MAVNDNDAPVLSLDTSPPMYDADNIGSGETQAVTQAVTAVTAVTPHLP